MLTGLCSVDENNVVGISSTQRKETLSKFVGKGIYINHKKIMLTLFVMKLLSIFANGTADVSSEQEAGDTSLRSDFGDMKFCSIQSLTKYF